LTRIRPDPRVARWLEAANDNLLYLSMASIGEFCKGFTVRPEQHRRAGLRQWLDNTLRPWFDARILPVREAIAEKMGPYLKGSAN
jgi:predicted nucleic acid-binding protein